MRRIKDEARLPVGTVGTEAHADSIGRGALVQGEGLF